MGCIKLDILEKSFVPMKVVYSSSDVEQKSVQRFLSVDPLAEKNPDKTPYHFVSNNPINRIDPDGRDDFEINSKGEIVNRIKNKKADNFYMRDGDGARIEGQSITFDYGTIESHRSQSGTYQKRNADGTRSE